ncbi:DUF1028 domain-containing protein [Mangrovibacillus cuniculi]|uniref:DUF1028 domain-containing protein n=1 Tax=Mangrovibacillus cuniculi TaxID=2593652 RepID=A0A7S8HG17_9BACI|nr:DUF1028 domain-containing protein [Mangrovibacillus cuniculi]QPC47494.1 DUF1028 domain-containing protein [Mangrovibacillus cuniculi]
MTFSIVGYDPKEKEWGIAVQSKFLGVGSVVPFAIAGVGAVATQSYANTTYGPKAMELFGQGLSAEDVIEKLTAEDPDRALRQVGVIDASGRPASFTGEGCYDWAGGKTGEHYAAQGNILVDENTVEAMATTFEKTEGTLANRLLQALLAGQHAGGDSRGQQSAAILVVKEKGGYGGFNDRYIDLRVDDHPTPIEELIRIYDLQQLYFAPSSPDRVEAWTDFREELNKHLEVLGYLDHTKTTEQALRDYHHTENFEMREQKPGFVDLDVYEYMKTQVTRAK